MSVMYVQDDYCYVMNACFIKKIKEIVVWQNIIVCQETLQCVRIMNYIAVILGKTPDAFSDIDDQDKFDNKCLFSTLHICAGLIRDIYFYQILNIIPDESVFFECSN